MVDSTTMRLRAVLTVVLGLAAAVLLLLFVGSLGQTYPGNPVVAVAMGVVFFLIGLSALRAVTRGRVEEKRSEPEDVADLDVFFVCGECGTAFRVEKLGELQVPRHCGEPMMVERRPAGPG